jgi:Fe-Mn family superoxide dismutase
MTMTRREALKTTALAAAACVTASTFNAAFAQSTPAPAPPGGPFSLPALPYPMDALEPHVDAQTMEIHHGRHHAAYVTNLNRAIAGQPELARKPITELLKGLSGLPESIRTAVRNNGGGHYNHDLFWRMMKKGGGGEPKGELATAIERKFGGFAAFKEEFSRAALGQFGSGWAWLVLVNRELKIEGTPNQDSPAFRDATPLLGVDVWEHAYYLKYQNRRAEYVTAWFNVVNWDFVAERFASGGRP